MSIESNQDLISKIIVSAFPYDFWIDLRNSYESTYATADETTENPNLMFLDYGKTRVRPQIRHYALNGAFKEAADRNNIHWSISDTKPKGEEYVVLKTKGLKVSRIGMNHDKQIIKKANYKILLAELNDRLEGVTYDLFEDKSGEIPSQKDNFLGAFIININPPHNESQRKILDIRFGIPFTNLKGFHFDKSIIEIMGMYEIFPQENIILDKAIPTLKRKLIELEG